MNFGKLREEYGRSDWAKENILIAVAGAETDGTSGIRDANDATLRQEIEKFAHVIFASSPAQRDWQMFRPSDNQVSPNSTLATPEGKVPMVPRHRV